MLKPYKVIIKTLGPVHIGSGQEIQKSEYVYDKNDGMLYVMDTYRLFKGLTELGALDRFEEYIMRSPETTMTDFVTRNGIRKYKEWAAYSYFVGKNEKRQNPIKAFVKDAYGMPYIPGSSLKGAVRNALMSALLIQNNDKYAEIALSVENERKGYNYLARQSSEVDVKLFHQRRVEDSKPSNAVNSKLRGLRISDSLPISTDRLTVCKKTDVMRDGTAKDISLLRECIIPGTELIFDLTLDTDAFKFSTEALENAVKINYNNIKTKFMDSFGVSVKNNAKKGAYIFVGGGTGYVSKTAAYSLFYTKQGNQRAVKASSKILHNVFYKDTLPPKMKKMASHIEDYQKLGISPRTRKCAYYNNGLYDMGLCEISFQSVR